MTNPEPIADQRVPLTVAEAREAAYREFWDNWRERQGKTLGGMYSQVSPAAHRSFHAGWDAALTFERERHRALREAARQAAGWLEQYGRTESEAMLSSGLRAALEALEGTKA